MKNNNLCAVVSGSNMDGIIQNVFDVQQKVDCIEVRIDYLKNQKKCNLIPLKEITDINMIITCRRKDEGGKWNGNEMKRLQLLRQAYDLGFSYVDVELSTLEEGQFKIPRNTKTKTIISFHDFAETPSLDDLRIIGERMQKYMPHIKKIATIVKDEVDVHALYRMLLEKKEGEKYCVIGMGKNGKQTRIVSSLLGGFLTYCSINTEGATAPGQMTCDEMKKIYKLLY